METRELVQDVNLHWSDLTKLIGSMNKLLYNAAKRRGNEMMQTVLQPLWPQKIKQETERLGTSGIFYSRLVLNSICKYCSSLVLMLLLVVKQDI